VPADGVSDTGDFFSRNAEAKAGISAQFRKLEAEHGFRMLLVVESVLIGTTAPELAARLQQAWLPQGDGLVIVFEADSRSLGFGRDLDSSPVSASAVGRVPTHETSAILSRVLGQTDPALEPEAYLATLCGNLAREFEAYFQHRNTPPPPERSLRIGLIAIGGLALLGLLAILVGSLVRLPSMAGERSYHFPESNHPERLGAPAGGGNVTVRRFKKP
jgi:hypothetical protein